uniref:Deoxynucleoside triphosphate triphosphohydrolase SAMHD1-like n=1 Tax=Sinocyclocheilus grahami TaxID=75366 RepID=A0A672L1L9_SINGR
MYLVSINRFSVLQIFNDPVHGHIELHPLLVQMIDTPQFQRLRYIKQLGTKYLVYPGATHTRFEHSIGVAHLAGCLLKTLHENQPELNITKQDFLCVQIAALCHDMGHGPFSHLFDGMFIPEVLPGNIYVVLLKHEQASVDMFRCMRKKNGLDKEMERYGLNLPEDIQCIEELILKGQRDGQWSMKGRTEDKSFLYEIVANKVNGIDVDKWDYLVRDCYYLGIPCGFDSQRLLKSARVCNVNERKHICFRDKVADNIYGMFHTRYTLHRQALQHKIGYIIDVKWDALVVADGKLSPDRKISDAIDDMLEYTKLTDHVFDQILNQSDSNADLAKARSILQDVVNRRLPKFVGEARLNEKELKVPYWCNKTHLLCVKAFFSKKAKLHNAYMYINSELLCPP